MISNMHYIGISAIYRPILANLTSMESLIYSAFRCMYNYNYVCNWFCGPGSHIYFQDFFFKVEHFKENSLEKMLLE